MESGHKSRNSSAAKAPMNSKKLIKWWLQPVSPNSTTLPEPAIVRKETNFNSPNNPSSKNPPSKTPPNPKKNNTKPWSGSPPSQTIKTPSSSTKKTTLIIPSNSKNNPTPKTKPNPLPINSMSTQSSLSPTNDPTKEKTPFKFFTPTLPNKTLPQAQIIKRILKTLKKSTFKENPAIKSKINNKNLIKNYTLITYQAF